MELAGRRTKLERVRDAALGTVLAEERTLGNGTGRGLPLWSGTVVIGMAIRGLYVPTSGSLNFAFLYPRGPPPRLARST